MNETISVINKSLNQILNKLEKADSTIKMQGDEVNKYLQKMGNFNASELLIAQQKSTRTSVELLRDEIEEIYELIKQQFKGQIR